MRLWASEGAGKDLKQKNYYLLRKKIVQILECFQAGLPLFKTSLSISSLHMKKKFKYLHALSSTSLITWLGASVKKMAYVKKMEGHNTFFYRIWKNKSLSKRKRENEERQTDRQTEKQNREREKWDSQTEEERHRHPTYTISMKREREREW